MWIFSDHPTHKGVRWRCPLPSAFNVQGMTSPDSEMQRYYANRAPYYDAVYDKPERRGDIAFLKSHLPAQPKGHSVIEVACGTGYWTQFIAPVATSYLAFDSTPEPLEFARLRPDTDNVQFRLGDAYAPPNGTVTYQAAFAGLWFSHVPIERRSVFLTALHRTLRQGARVIFIDNSEVQCREFPIVERDARGNSYQHRQLRNGSIHRVLKNFPNQAELEQMLSGIGEQVQYRELANFWLLEYAVAHCT